MDFSFLIMILSIFAFALLLFYVIEKFVAMPKYERYAKIIPIFLVHYVFVCTITLIPLLILFNIDTIGYILILILLSIFIVKYFNFTSKIIEHIFIFILSIFVIWYIDSNFMIRLGISELICTYLLIFLLYYFASHLLITFFVVLKRAIFYGGLFIINKFSETIVYSIVFLLSIFTGGVIAIFALIAVIIHLPYIGLIIIGLVYSASLYFYIKEELNILKEKKNAKLRKYKFEREV